MICTTALIFLKLTRTDLAIAWIYTLIPIIAYSILNIILTILTLIGLYKTAKGIRYGNGEDKDEEEYRKHLEESRKKMIKLRNKLS